ncbi:hypothetical protein [Thioalkalivibrio sp. HK1]|uniref:hypothetical protein n=1 Tax=Thioalkalivibrio sp. HK1 TaxID=1469245 RepID=UPI0004AFBCC4|nr:hypothetical protein [Thioalkalivibrio sp. HK1]
MRDTLTYLARNWNVKADRRKMKSEAMPSRPTKAKGLPVFAEKPARGSRSTLALD